MKKWNLNPHQKSLKDLPTPITEFLRLWSLWVSLTLLSFWVAPTHAAKNANSKIILKKFSCDTEMKKELYSASFQIQSKKFWFQISKKSDRTQKRVAKLHQEQCIAYCEEKNWSELGAKLEFQCYSKGLSKMSTNVGILWKNNQAYIRVGDYFQGFSEAPLSVKSDLLFDQKTSSKKLARM